MTRLPARRFPFSDSRFPRNIRLPGPRHNAVVAQSMLGARTEETQRLPVLWYAVSLVVLEPVHGVPPTELVE